jgi:hypothetical protein
VVAGVLSGNLLHHIGKHSFNSYSYCNVVHTMWQLVCSVKPYTEKHSFNSYSYCKHVNPMW